MLFVSVVNDEIREIIKKANAFHINFFETFLGLLEKELNTEAVAAQQGTTVSAIPNAMMRVWRRSISH